MNTPTKFEQDFTIIYRGRTFVFDYLTEPIPETTIETLKRLTKPKKENVAYINDVFCDLWIQDRIKMVRLLASKPKDGFYYQMILKEQK